MSRLVQLSLMQVFWMCLMVVVLVFVGYEVAERIWLQQADAGLRHVLHLVLGVSASALTATVATYVLLCQFDACGVDAPSTVVPRSWAKRLQHVGLRTKLIVPMVALAVVPGIGIGLFALSEVRSLVDSSGAGSSAAISEMSAFLLIAMVLVLSVAAITGALVAHYVTRPVALLRGATHAIAAGDLSRRVELETGDEIESLAGDFNIMTARLEEAQRRLAAWNADLQREVERRTTELHGMQAGLARVDRLSTVGQMTASIMHEIGNPLAAIKTKIQVAEERDGGSPVLTALLEEVDRLGGVLRTYSRLNRLQPTALADAHLGEVVQGVAALIGPELRRKGVHLVCRIPESVPTVRGDPDRLRQLFINFILNAAEALPNGGPVRVTIQPCDAATDRVTVEVEDSGVGIPEAVRLRMWDPFFTTKASGTGLGLAISKQIIDEHGGGVEVESRPGQGTRVRVSFPCVGRRPRDDAGEARPTQAATG